MANRVYVPGYGYVTQGEAGTGVTSQPGWQRPASWGQPSSRPSSSAPSNPNGSQRGVAAPQVTAPPQPAATNLSNPVVPYASTGQMMNDQTYWNSLRVGRYGPPGGMDSPLAQGTGAPGSALRELPAIFTATTVGQAKDAYWNDPISRSLIEQAAAVHYAGNPNFIPQWAENFWNDIISTSISPGAQSPWETIEGILSGRVSPANDQSSSSPNSSGSGSYGGGGYSGGGGGGGGQVSLTNPTSARGLLMQTMQNVLGRNPTESEYSTFLKTLNEAQMGNPMTVEMDGSNVVQSGGVDPNVLALEFAQGAEDYKSREASKYYNMFMAALGGASGG